MPTRIRSLVDFQPAVSLTRLRGTALGDAEMIMNDEALAISLGGTPDRAPTTRLALRSLTEGLPSQKQVEGGLHALNEAYGVA